MEMGGSSNAVDVSTLTEELKYMQASNVNVCNFVSVKLSGRINYKIWKAQMLCLINSQALLHIIVAENPLPTDNTVNEQYDQLVKGWIFGSMTDHVLNNYADLDSAREVWMQLESCFGVSIEGVSSNELDVSSRKEDLKYILASTINVFEYVTVKLSGHNNYDIWKAQMFCLIESHELLHIIHAEIRLEGVVDPMTQKYDKLVKGWILDTISDPVDKHFILYSSAQSLWWSLKLFYTEGDSSYVRRTKDLNYMQASNVNVSNFVSVKLSGPGNYEIWKTQILCLLHSQGLLQITEEGGDKMPDNYHYLVMGWIFSTMNDQVLQKFHHQPRMPILWSELESTYAIQNGNSDGEVGFVFGIEAVTNIPEIENTVDRKRLYEAAVDGCWWKAKSILKVDKNAATKEITPNGNTILHIAVEMGHNYFVEKLLEFLKDHDVIIEKKILNGWTALHIAAVVGNTDAAQLLVKKRRELLMIKDDDEDPPFYTAYENRNMNISTYLLKSTESSDLRTYSHNYHQGSALVAAIFSKQYDLAKRLLNEFSDCADLLENGSILLALTMTFPTNLCSMESFIYPSFHNVYQKIVMRGSLLFHSNFLVKCVDDILRVVKNCKKMCCCWFGEGFMILLVSVALLYLIYKLICLLSRVVRLQFSMLYLLIWKFLAVTVRPIKNIEKKKKNEYEEAKKVLCLICNQMGTSNGSYGEALYEAVRQDTYELAIINRSEKVYNLIYHIIQRKLAYREIRDSHENTLAHLACKLAPSFVLQRTTGAALQLQRELLWREEVEKLFLPLQLREKNIYNETPSMVFTKEHQDLMKQGENWIKTTAQFCSITTALIVTVVFAAAITVPGGRNQHSGIPLYKNEITFIIFGVCNAFSLFTAATALLLLLSILTARFSERDFLVSLPRRLIFGLLLLFLSTTSMMIAFGAILFLVFCDQRPWMLVPICVFACLPISVIVTIKLPLLVDLIQSTYSPIFGKLSYLESCKVNRKYTIFME